MHDVKALIARSDKLAAAARQFENAIVCPLVQGFSLLPITDALAKELTAYQSETKAALMSRIAGKRPLLPQRPGKPIQEFSDGLHALAIEISQGSPVAYITTFYFGGQGGQDALVWNKGRLRFSSRNTVEIWRTPISQALRKIGVVAETGMDEFDTLGLGKHRETHQWAASLK
jgi:hypothetical protein